MLATPAPQVLEQIEASLAEMLRQAHEREQALPAPTDSGRQVAWTGALARLDDRLAALDDCAGRAGRAVGAADTILAEAAAGIVQWLAAAQMARPAVADRADGAVS